MYNHNQYIVLIANCTLCPIHQAGNPNSQKCTEWSKAFREYILSVNNNINIIQLPCPESSFNACIPRAPHGFDYYSKLPGFTEHCESLARSVTQEILGLSNSRQKVICIVGIEHSPTCAVNYLYTNKGTIHQQGIFIEKLSTMLQTENISIPFVGINRRFYQKGIMQLDTLIQKYL